MWRRRSILLAGAFSALLLVLAVSAFAVWRSARSTQDRVTTLHAAQMQADDVLDAIRDNVYLQGLLTRDYLLDSDPAQAPKYQAKFDELRARMEQNFQRLEAAGEAGVQLSAVSQLRRE